MSPACRSPVTGWNQTGFGTPKESGGKAGLEPGKVLAPETSVVGRCGDKGVVMRLHTIFTPAAVVLAIAVASTPAVASQRERPGRGAERGRSDRAENQNRAVEHGRPHGDAAPRTHTRPQASGPRAL